MRKNIIKEKLQSKKQVLGIWQGINSTSLVEMCGYSGFDFIIFDTEHGAMNVESCIPMVCAAEKVNIIPIIRVSEIEKTYILKALDIGMMGIIFPMVNSKRDAEKAVSLSKYVERGDTERKLFRGLSSSSRATGYSLNVNKNTHIETSNNEIILIMQLETLEAVKNLDDILEVKEIDVIFIGRGDLSQSLGCPGEVNNPEVIKIVKASIKKIINAGKIVGIADGNIESISNWIDLGVNLITCSQTPIVSKALINFSNDFKELVKKKN